MSKQKITIAQSDLEAAARAGAMSPADVESLWQELYSRAAGTAKLPEEVGANNRFDMAQLAWYAGGFLVLIAMGWLLERVGSAFGQNAVGLTAIAYGVGFAALGYKLRFKDGIKTPGGVLFALATLMVPLAYGALIGGMDVLSNLGPSRFALSVEALTLAVALPTAYYVRSSVLSAVVYFVLWLASMTLASIMAGGQSSFWGFGSDYYLAVSATVGLAMLVSAVVVDVRLGRSEDYSFWGYLFGALAFWGSLSLLLVGNGGEGHKLVYFAICLALMVSSVVLARRSLLLVGSLGCIYYVGHLLSTFFAGSILFPFALIAMGVGVIYLGVQYRRYRLEIESYLVGLVPAGLRNRLPGAGAR